MRMPKPVGFFEPIRLLPDGRLAPSRVVTITVTAGEPETGGWCDHCLLPSVITVPVLAESGRVIARYVYCDECERLEAAR